MGRPEQSKGQWQGFHQVWTGGKVFLSQGEKVEKKEGNEYRPLSQGAWVGRCDGGTKGSSWMFEGRRGERNCGGSPDSAKQTGENEGKGPAVVEGKVEMMILGFTAGTPSRSSIWGQGGARHCLWSSFSQLGRRGKSGCWPGWAPSGTQSTSDYSFPRCRCHGVFSLPCQFFPSENGGRKLPRGL